MNNISDCTSSIHGRLQLSVSLSVPFVTEGQQKLLDPNTHDAVSPAMERYRPNDWMIS